MKPKLDMSYISTLKQGYCVRIVRFGIRRDFFHHLMVDQDALSAAIAYRDRMYELHGIGPRSTSKPNVRINSRGQKGALSGVSLGIELPWAYFVARVYDGKKWVKHRFSIGNLGYENAFRLAVERRLSETGLNIDPSEIELHRPTMAEFLKLSRVFKDIPVPLVTR